MAAAELTRSLVVRATAEGKVVHYSIFSSALDAKPIKVTRYSELAVLHQAITKEVPTFGVDLPEKAYWSRNTPEFVEKRREHIELYLRHCATNIRESAAFTNLFAACAPPEPVEEEKVGDRRSKADSEGDLALTGTLEGPAGMELETKRQALAAAKENVEELNNRLRLMESSSKGAGDAADKRADSERQAADQLRAHRSRLEKLQRDLMAKRAVKADVELQKTTEAQRLEQNLATAMEATKAAHARRVAARRARAQAAVEFEAKAAEAERQVTLANGPRSVAVEVLGSAKATLSMLNEHLGTRKLEARQAELDREGCQKKLEKLQKDLATAEEDQKAAAAAASKAMAAVNGHTEGASRRARACEAEVSRAEACAAEAEELSEVSSRMKLNEEDRTSLEAATQIATDAVEATSRALKVAKQHRDETQAADAQKAKALKAEADTAAVDSKRCETKTGQLKQRISKAVLDLQASVVACASADVALQSVEAQHASLKTETEGKFQKAIADAEAELEAAKRNVVDLKRKTDIEMMQLRHAEETEDTLVTQQESSEASLAAALDAARTLVAEAKEDQAEVSLARDNSLVENAKARFADRQRVAQETAEAAKQSLAAIETAEALKARIEEREAGEAERDEQVSALKARIEELKKAAVEKEAVQQGAAAAAEEAEGELRALEAIPSEPIPSTLQLVDRELTTVVELIGRHGEAEASAIDESKRCASDWAVQKASLQEELHRANIGVKAAQDDIASFLRLHETLK